LRLLRIWFTTKKLACKWQLESHRITKYLDLGGDFAAQSSQSRQLSVILSVMSIDSILAEIDAEIARLTEARGLLASMGSITSAANKGKAATKAAKKTGKKRVLSAEARKRIADAQRKRWAAQRAKAKAK
jgi:hypothetical protein